MTMLESDLFGGDPIVFPSVVVFFLPTNVWSSFVVSSSTIQVIRVFYLSLPFQRKEAMHFEFLNSLIQMIIICLSRTHESATCDQVVSIFCFSSWKSV